jgi:hypothetical protein
VLVEVSLGVARRGIAYLLGLLVAALAGCANSYCIPLPAATTTTDLFGGDGRRIVALQAFEDQRDLSECKKDEDGDPPRISCSPEAPAWFADRLEQALRAAGFEVIRDEQLVSPSDPWIRGTLVVLDVRPVSGFSAVTVDADILLRLRVGTAGGLEAERSFAVKSERSSWVTTESMAKEALEEATRRITRDMVAAVVSLLNRFPEVGRESRIGSLGGAP